MNQYREHKEMQKLDEVVAEEAANTWTLNSTLQAMLMKKYNQFKQKMEESTKVVDDESCAEKDAASYVQRRNEEMEMRRQFEVCESLLFSR